MRHRGPVRRLLPVLVAAGLLMLAACSGPTPTAPGADRFGQAIRTVHEPIAYLQFTDLAQLRDVLGRGAPGPDGEGLLNLTMPVFTVLPDSTLREATWSLRTSRQTRIAGAADTLDDFKVVESDVILEPDGKDIVIRPGMAPGPSPTGGRDARLNALSGCLDDPDVATLFIPSSSLQGLGHPFTAVGLGSRLTTRSQGEHRLCLLLADGADPQQVADAFRQAQPRQAPEPTFTAGEITVDGRTVRIELLATGSDAVAAAARLHQNAPEAQAPWF